MRLWKKACDIVILFSALIKSSVPLEIRLGLEEERTAPTRVCIQHHSPEQVYKKVCGTGSEFRVDERQIGEKDSFLIETLSIDGEKVLSRREIFAKDLLLQPAAQKQSCTLHLLSPSVGETIVEELEVHIELVGCKSPENGLVGLVVNNELSLLDSSQSVELDRDGVLVQRFRAKPVQVQYGTHQIKAVLMGPNGETLPLSNSSKTHTLFNLVPFTKFTSTFAGRRTYDGSGLYRRGKHMHDPVPFRIGFFGNYNLDGQKTIWLSVLKYLKEKVADFVEPTFLFFLEDMPDKPFVKLLDRLDVDHVAIPLRYQPTGLFDIEQVSSTLQKVQKLPLLVASHRICVPRHVKRSQVCKRVLWELLSMTVPGNSVDMVLSAVGVFHLFDVVVYGNSRLHSDVLLEACAELAGVTLTVVDIPNHDPAKGLWPTVFVAPSWFSHDHPSIQVIHGVHKVVIYPGIDFNHFRFTSARKRSVDETVAIGFLARLAPEKLPGLFLDLVERLVSRNPTTKFRFVMAGSGILEADLRALALAKRLSVEFLGHVPYEDVPALLESLDFTVHLRFDETFCLSNVESMAMGVPVIGFGSAAVSEYSIHGVNSWIATKPTLDSLVEAAETAIREWTNETPARCAASVQRFSSHRMVEAYSHLFLDLLGVLAESDREVSFNLAIDPSDLGIPQGAHVCIEHLRESQVNALSRVCSPVHSSEPIHFVVDGRMIESSDTLLVQGLAQDRVQVLASRRFLGAYFLSQIEAVEASRPCKLKFVSPRFGETFVFDSNTASLDIKLQLLGCRVPEDGTVELTVEKKSAILDKATEQASGVSFFEARVTGLTSGSHRSKAVFRYRNGQLEHPRHVESMFVNLLPQEIARSKPAGRKSYDAELAAERYILESPCRVAFFGNYVMDGQKTIWFEMLKEMKQRIHLFTVEFLFLVPKEPHALFAKMLDEIQVPHATVPLHLAISPRGISEDEVDLVLNNIIDALYRVVEIRPFSRACRLHRRRDRPSIRWLIDLLSFTVPHVGLKMVSDILGALDGYDVLVYGNSGKRTDVLVQLCAELVGVTLTVVDLPNHFPVQGLFPTVFIAPSWFSHDHPSIQAIHGVHKVVIYPGIDFNHFRFTSARKQSVDETVAIGFLARLAPEKLPGLFLDLVERLVSRNPTTKFRFVMAGSGILEADLRALALAKRLSVEFLGHVPYDDVPALLESLDFTVHLRFDETFCLSNVESMAMGVPVIGFGSAAVSEYSIHGVNSWIATKPTLDSLVEAAETAIREWTNETPARCAASVQQFSSHRMVEAYSHLFVDMSGTWVPGT